VHAASTQNTPRQPAASASQVIGRVPTAPPIPAKAISTPLAVPSRSGGQNSVLALKPAIRQVATPAPIRPRPIVSAAIDCALAKAIAPQAATNSSTACTRRGP
jgi:hypothetical protein